MRGTIRDISFDGLLTVEITEGEPPSEMIGKDLAIEFKPWREKRSRSANALLWSCLGEIASALGGTKWEHYLTALRRYGKFTLMRIKEEAVEAFMQSYRECEEVGRKDGWVDLLVYFGSSTYDSKEFAVLLDGVIDDMKQAGLPTPTSAEMRRAIEQLEKEEQKHGEA